MNEPAPSSGTVIDKTGPRAGFLRLVHASGFVLGLGLLVWCVWLVASDQQRLNEAKRLATSPGTLALLIALSIGVSVCTGMMFWAVFRPVKRLPIADVLAVNAIATLLGNLPFKLSIVARGYLHRTRNGVPVPLIFAWMGASLGVMAIGLLPPIVATLVLKRVDAVWWAVVVGGTLLLAAAAVGVGRFASTEWFWGKVNAWGTKCPRTIGRLIAWPGFSDFSRGHEMLGCVPAVGQGVLWRSGAMGFGVWRFVVAAGAVGGAMTVGQCVVADSVYFSIQATAPTGALGAREGGTVAVIAAMAGEKLPVVVLAVSAAETAANLLCAGVGLLYLKLVRPTTPPQSEPRP